ncbi:hypothetical protein DPMN_107355 [Dreissena polymorpha]|uniref:Uncharacterized protein n=1 Tax=Dreissena polymorpha TaxID=45954 RepID=A0A9D4K6K2_DREPO|nr:hypothetical protein DPMN_107355 [Dreissena polymorpha]
MQQARTHSRKYLLPVSVVHVKFSGPNSTIISTDILVLLKVTSPMSLESHVPFCRSRGNVHTADTAILTGSRIGAPRRSAPSKIFYWADICPLTDCSPFALNFSSETSVV